MSDVIDTEKRLIGFKGRHLVSIDDFSKAELEYIFAKAKELKVHLDDPKQYASLRQVLDRHVGALIFLEPSTRTFDSFKRAGALLGAQVPVEIKDPSNSSFVKGESLADTLRTLVEQHKLSYVIIRSSIEGMAAFAAKALDRYTASKGLEKVTVFNAGDGRHEHPTQAILDMMTVMMCKGRLDNLKVVLQGDLENSRTIHSFLKILLKYPGNEYWLLSTPEFALPDDYKSMIKNAGATFHEVASYSFDLLDGKDVLYLSRPQAERFKQKISDTQKEAYMRAMTLRSTHLPALDRCPFIMHALPIDERFGEVDEDVKDHERFVAFRQAGYGTLTRAAELLLFLGATGWGDELPPFIPKTHASSEILIDSTPVTIDQERMRHHIIGPIREGWVIDKVPPDRGLYLKILSMLPDPSRGEFNGLVFSQDGRPKYIIKREGFDVPEDVLHKILMFSPQIKLNRIEFNGETIEYLAKSGAIRRDVGVCTEKRSARLPDIAKELYECPNLACVSRLKNVPSEFKLIDSRDGVYKCVYDDTTILTKEARYK